MKKVVTILMALVLLALPFAMAAPTGGVTSQGASETGTGSSSSTVNIEGGNVTLVNVSGDAVTANWGGFYGNITGGLKLSDAGNNNFYEWSVSDLTGAVVYATNDTTTFGSLVAGTNGVQPSYVNAAGTDNWTSTFSATENFNSSSIANIASTPYVDTYQSNASGTLRTYSLYDSADAALVYAAKAQDDAAGFTGASVDFQLLVPANTVTTYNFYLELP